MLSVKRTAARCRPLNDDRILTYRGAIWDLVPGHIITIAPKKQWTYARHSYISGDVVDATLQAERLELTPLQLHSWGMWDPDEQYWGEDDDEDDEGVPSLPEWAQPIIARGPRPEYEMEQVLPGWDPGTWEDDPIFNAVELRRRGDAGAARDLLMKLCEADLRCLDAHAHLGNWVLDYDPEEALQHYDVGIGIAELTLGASFDGVLPWSLIDNRPFLRCLFGRGLSLWRLNRLDEAAQVFERLLWLSPSDSLGARFNLEDVRAGRRWDTVVGRDG